MKKLLISKTLALPLDAVTQKLAFLGRTGSGKTFGCKRMVEQMLRCKAQVVILDGSGGWAGLRLGPKAFKIPVFGGLHGDIPLEPSAGELIANLIVDRGISVVLDVSQMLDAERTRFATAFAKRFFQRKKASPSAVHVVLEECQDFVPENCQRGEEQMLHEFQRLAKQGRPHGIGISFISQRPQEISKKALNQAECVFAFQMNGPHERKALQYWLSDKGFEGKLADVLPTLEIGAPYVWSPQWLKISKIVRILPIDSLDTSATPKVGGKVFKQKKLTPIDLKGITTAMAETVERAKSEDPKELHKQIDELKRALKRMPDHGPAGPTVTVEKLVKGIKLDKFEVVVDRRHLEETIEVSEGFEADVLGFEKLIGGLKQALNRIHVSANVTAKAARRARDTGPAALSKRLAKAPPATPRTSPPAVALKTMAKGTIDKPFQSIKEAIASVPDVTLGRCERALLTAIVQRHPKPSTAGQLTLLTEYRSSSSTFNNALSALRKAGFIEGGRRDGGLQATDAGVRAAGAVDPIPSGRELLDHWLNRLGKCEGTLLESISSAYPNPISKEALSEVTGYAHTSSTFNNGLSALRTLELISRGAIRLSEELVG